MSVTQNGLSERVRLQLNKLDEKDRRGNETRFWWQVGTAILGSLLMSSTDDEVRRSGKALVNGAVASFLDLLNLKITRWALDSRS